jgi:Helix-turn-helix.
MPPVKKPKRTRHHTYIKAWREFRHLSQDRVAERIGISRENYGRIESGKVPYNQDFLEVCADALSCSVTDLLTRDPLVDGLVDRLRRMVETASPEDQQRIFDVAETLLKSRR